MSPNKAAAAAVKAAAVTLAATSTTDPKPTVVAEAAAVAPPAGTSTMSPNKPTAAAAVALPPAATSTMSRPPKMPSLKTDATAKKTPPPPIPPPVPMGSSTTGTSSHRNNSASSNATTSTTNSMDRSDRSRMSLRESVNQRRMSLTRPEQDFLDALVIHGNEIEVSLAMEKLSDENLFFLEKNSNKQQQPADNNNAKMTSSSSSSLEENIVWQDLQRASIHSSSTNNNTPGVTTSNSRSGNSGMDNTNMSDMSSTLDRIIAADAARAANIINNNSNDHSAPPLIMATSSATTAVMVATTTTNYSSSSVMVAAAGSARRQELLQIRRNSLLYGKIWKAHETGLSVSNNASRRSVSHRRSNSVGSLGSNMSSSMNQRTSFGRHVFRRQSLTKQQQQQKVRSISLGGAGKDNDALFQTPTTPNMLGASKNVPTGTTFVAGRRSSFQNSGVMMNDAKSDNFRRQRTSLMVVPPFKNVEQRGQRMMRRKSVSSPSSAAAMMSNHTSPSLPLLQPLRPALRRLMSDGSGRKSVTFGDLPLSLSAARGQLHTLVDESDESNNTSGKEEVASSSSFTTALKQDAAAALPPTIIPQSQQPGPLFMSDDSDQFSIPSLHLAHPLRSFSILSNNSIPSLHLAHPIRSNSTDSRSVGQAAAAAAFSFEGSFDDRDPSETAGSRFEEKKTESSDDIIMKAWLNNNNNSSSSVPTRVVVPQQDGGTSTSATTSDQQQPQPIATQPLHDEQRVVQQRALLIREASVNAYRGEGMEIAEFDDGYHLPQAGAASESRPVVQSSLHAFIQNPLSSNINFNIDNNNGFVQQSESLLSFGGGESSRPSIHFTSSFDETMSVDCSSRRRQSDDIFRQSIQAISRSLSDDDINGVFLGESRYYTFHETSTAKECKIPDNDDDDGSWRLGDEDEDLDYYDPWLVIEDEYENGYGGGNTLPFRILGTSGNDLDARPHVMSPPLMESLQAFLPYSKSGENFWMKFSMVRDGASMSTFLRHARGSKHTFLAVETTDGEVFGSFTSAPWRKNWNYFGGQDSFLWRMRHTRKEKSHSIIDQAKIESEIDVFHCTGENYNIQLCTHDKIAVGGSGAGDSSEGIPPNDAALAVNDQSPIKQHEWGFGLTIDEDLLQGTSSPCLTFGCPSLSNVHADGSRFEIINLELWTLTPYDTVQDAEKLELGLLFLDTQKTSTDSGNCQSNSKDDEDDYELSASPLSPSVFSPSSNLAVASSY